MNWTSWGEFLAMGGHGLYVWGSFGMCAVAIAAEVLMQRFRRKALRPDFDAVTQQPDGSWRGGSAL